MDAFKLIYLGMILVTAGNYDLLANQQLQYLCIYCVETIATFCGRVYCENNKRASEGRQMCLPRLERLSAGW